MKKKVKSEGGAKHHSFFSNMYFTLKFCNKHDKWAVLTNLCRSPLILVFDMIVMYFVTALTWCIENKKGLVTIIAVCIGLALFSGAVAIAMNKLEEIHENKRVRINRRFEIMLGEKIMNLDYSFIEGPLGRNKYQKAKNALGYEGVYGFIFYLGGITTSLLGISSYGAITACLSPWLILILIGSQLLALTSTALENHLINKTKDTLAEIDRKLDYMTKTSRDFAIAKDIRIFRLREYMQNMSEYFIGEKKLWTKKKYFYYFLSDSLNLFLNVGIEIGVFAYIVHKSMQGELTNTELVLYALSILEFSHWVGDIGSYIGEIIPANMKIDDLREFLALENNGVKRGNIHIPAEKLYEITLKNVSFTYPESEERILDNITLTIKKGERLALVGVNGAGKTTLVKLLCGLYQPTEGKILINGADISDINRDEYFTAISAVFQEARVMPVTILENISMLPEEDSDREKATACLKQSGLYEKTQMLPEKENTLLVKSVNENAVELSGGELQRLLLSRAIYKNAPLLFLDEPTAALDAIAENEVYLKYNSLCKNRTSVYISHRLSSTRFCDRIALLSGGKITELGTHDELMKLGGEYENMFNVQSKYYEKGAEENVG